jgi:hypothetical protein
MINLNRSQSVTCWITGMLQQHQVFEFFISIRQAPLEEIGRDMMKDFFQRFGSDVTVIEYVLMAALIAVGVIAAVSAL